MIVIVQSPSNTRKVGLKFVARHIAKRDNGIAYTAAEMDRDLDYYWKFISPSGRSLKYGGGKKCSAMPYLNPTEAGKMTVITGMKLKTEKTWTVASKSWNIPEGF